MKFIYENGTVPSKSGHRRIVYLFWHASLPYIRAQISSLFPEHFSIVDSMSERSNDGFKEIQRLIMIQQSRSFQRKERSSQLTIESSLTLL